MAIDYVAREVRLDVNIWIGDETEREAYRRAAIVLTEVSYWVCEPPDAHVAIEKPGPVKIDIGRLTDSVPKEQPALPSVPQNVFGN